MEGLAGLAGLTEAAVLATEAAGMTAAVAGVVKVAGMTAGALALLAASRTLNTSAQDSVKGSAVPRRPPMTAVS